MSKTKKETKISIKAYFLGIFLKSKLFYLLIMLTFFILFGYTRYQHSVYIPEEDKVFRVENYSLGEDGKRPFYQTEKDLKLSGDLNRIKKSFFLSGFAGLYYNKYKRQYSRGRLMTQYLKVGPEQLPEIYVLVKDASTLLGLEKIPNIYITDSNGTNISVTNYIDPSILISADFGWAFKPEELRFLLAQNVAHIKLNHVYYLDMIKGMQSIFQSVLPDFLSEILIGSVGLKLIDWYKEAEISADRGGLVVTGNMDIALHALVKLNIGSNIEDSYSKINIKAYIEQLNDIKDDRLKNLSATIAELNNPNPFITVRVRHLLNWYNSNREIFK